MNRLDVLKNYHVILAHNLLCCSGNYAMTRPRAGYEEEWQRISEELAVLDEMIDAQKRIDALAEGIRRFGIPKSVHVDNPNEQAAPVQTPERQEQIDLLDQRLRATRDRGGQFLVPAEPPEARSDSR